MKRDYLILLLLTIAGLALPRFLTNKYYLTVFIVVGIHSILVLGLNLLMGYAGQISLGHAGFYALGAYFSGVLTTVYQVDPWAGMFLAALATGVLAFFIGIPTLKLEGHYLAMATLGIGVIIQKLIEEFKDLTGGNNGMTDIPPLVIGSIARNPATQKLELVTIVLNKDIRYFYFVLVVVLILTLLSIHLIHSRIGRACRAIHSSLIAAQIMGVNVQKIKVQIFVLSAVYASIAGSLYAHYQRYLDPSPFGFGFSIELVVMVILGGLGSVWGGMLGAGILRILSEYVTAFREYGPIIYGLILITMVLFIPNGIAGLLGFLSGLFQRQKNTEVAT